MCGGTLSSFPVALRITSRWERLSDGSIRVLDADVQQVVAPLTVEAGGGVDAVVGAAARDEASVAFAGLGVDVCACVTIAVGFGLGLGFGYRGLSTFECLTIGPASATENASTALIAAIKSVRSFMKISKLVL